MTGRTGADETEVKQSAAARLAAAREEYAQLARRGRAGRDAASRHAFQMDGVVQAVVETARGRTTTPFVVCAVGGYGRRALCLHSDVDLFIGFDGTIGPAEEDFVKAVLQPLWDLRLELGQHVREICELSEPDLGNPEFLLSLIDLRYLAGDESLYDRIANTAASHAPAIIEPLLTLVAERHSQFNDTLYQLEPDIKQAPGGLRDIAVIRHLRRMAPDSFTNGRDVDGDRVAAAEDFLLRIRSLLHLFAGRDVNLLTHDLQEKVAEAMGSAGSHPHHRVEALMGEYFLRARAVTRALESTERALRPRPQGAVRRIGKQFEITPDGVQFSNVDRAREQPSLWLEAFRIALEHQCPVSESALALIEQHAHRCTADDFVATEGERLQLRRLFTPRAGLYDRLSEMHDCGLLNRIFPEFAKVQCRVVRDFYHKYTVDEHTLLAIRGVESLLDPASSASRRRFSSILQELRDPELLTLALLFHDVGKWREADHAQESVRLAQSVLDRLELPDDERATVEFLIREHLQMSQVAFRRDAEDPQVAARFAELVGTEERLKLLCLMTLADVGAVSPDTLTPWKEELLWRVYVDAYNRLTLGYADDLLEGHPAGVSVLIAGRPSDISEQELVSFLEGLPRRYLSTFGLGAVYRHVRLARNIQPDQIHTFLEKHDAVWELTLVTLDKPFLFSSVSGVLSYFGMDILRGQAMTTPDGLVLDVFEFSDDEGFLAQNAAAAAEISAMLEQVVAGSLDVTSLLKGRERSLLNRRRVRRAPVIHFDNEHSRKYTVLEIVADDAPGLLHRISRLLSAEGCDLHLALIATEGKRAIDVLHVTRAGGKLDDAEQSSIASELERVLEVGD